MARTTPAQKPRGEHSSTVSAGLGASVMGPRFDAWLRHSTWGYALGLSSAGRGTDLGRLLRAVQLGESLRRLDRIEPIVLVDGNSLRDRPASTSSLQPIEEPRVRRDVGEHVADLLAHQDDDTGLGERTIARGAHHGGKNVVFGTLAGLEALPAAVDEFTKAAAEPGDRNLALRYESGKQLRPFALIAINGPGLDQLGTGGFVVHGSSPRSPSPCSST